MITAPIGIENDLWVEDTINTHIWTSNDNIIISTIRYLAITGTIKVLQAIVGNVLSYKSNRIYTGA